MELTAVSLWLKRVIVDSLLYVSVFHSLVSVALNISLHNVSRQSISLSSLLRKPYRKYTLTLYQLTTWLALRVEKHFITALSLDLRCVHSERAWRLKPMIIIWYCRKFQIQWNTLWRIGAETPGLRCLTALWRQEAAVRRMTSLQRMFKENSSSLVRWGNLWKAAHILLTTHLIRSRSCSWKMCIGPVDSLTHVRLALHVWLIRSICLVVS